MVGVIMAVMLVVAMILAVGLDVYLFICLIESVVGSPDVEPAWNIFYWLCRKSDPEFYDEWDKDTAIRRWYFLNDSVWGQKK